MSFHTRTAKRGIVVVALLVSASTELLAQGTSPLAPSHRGAATSVYRPDSAGLESYCHRGRGLDVCLW